ncbi:unnamed protein product [Effrenium voratum]|uniref:Uncharacterized protein n=1 Tax=Effrenium voratum TaxID=2562239 RepID=A0AA36II57_9DINO|nr:unnamed protein product [Effrenium voratum]CAJ1419050.1 unnamed protein product [Effrenium voratum]
MIDLLDPLFTVRSDSDKALPGKQRETLRRGSWACCIVCGAVAMWDIMLHPVQEGAFDLPGDLHGLDDGLADLWDQNTMMLFRWKPGEGRDEAALLWAAAESLEVDAMHLKKQALFEEHRLLLFKYDAGKDGAQRAAASPVHAKWKEQIASPKGQLAQIVDTSFPTALNVTLCLHAHAHTELAKVQATKEKSAEAETAETAEAASAAEHPLPAEFAEIVGPSTDARDAYMAGCSWWTDTLDSFYGHNFEENATDMEAAHSSADDDDKAEGADLA